MSENTKWWGEKFDLIVTLYSPKYCRYKETKESSYVYSLVMCHYFTLWTQYLKSLSLKWPSFTWFSSKDRFGTDYLSGLSYNVSLERVEDTHTLKPSKSYTTRSSIKASIHRYSKWTISNSQYGIRFKLIKDEN